MALALVAPGACAGILPNNVFSAGAAGTTGTAFLGNTFGARAAAMGQTFAASAQGAEALFQNPAGMTRFVAALSSEFALGYDALLETAYEGSAVYAHTLGRGAFGTGFAYASQSPQTTYTSIGDSAGSFTPLDFAASAGYARAFGSLSIGGSLKLIRSSLADRSATTSAVDFGVLASHIANLGESPLDLGVAVSNLGPPLKLGSMADPLPLAIRAGSLWHVTPTFDAAFDVDFPVDQDPYITFGAEARFPLFTTSGRPWVASARAGYNQSQSRSADGFSGVSFGAGLNLATFRVDYAWSGLGALGDVNRFTLAFRF